MRANKDAQFAKYMNKEPRAVIPVKSMPLRRQGGGNPEFAIKEKIAGCPPSAFAKATARQVAGMTRY